MKMKLDTLCEKYGNEDGTQLSTFGMAVHGTTFNSILDDSFFYLNEVEEHELNDFNYMQAFMKTLTKEQAKAFSTDLDAFTKAVAEYEEQQKELYALGELPDDSELAKAIEETRNWHEDNMLKEWLYGDRSERGLLAAAERKYDGFMFAYDVKKDVFTVDAEDWKRDELRDEYGIAVDDEKAISEHLADQIENDAYAECQKLKKKREERREYNARVRRIREEHEEEERKRIAGELEAMAND